MKRIFFWLIKPWVRSFIGLSLLALLIWFDGPLLAYDGAVPLASARVRWICIGIPFLCWLVYFCWSMMQVRLSRVKPAAGVEADGTPEIKPETIAFDADMATLGKRMKEVKNALKKARYMGGGNADLPWYLMLGADAAGKSMVLSHADLKTSTLETTFNAVDSVGQARQCEWRLTDDAVLLDTPGRYTTQDSNREIDQRTWRSFLQMIRHDRRRRPINGVIVVLDVTDLLRKNHSALHMQALAMRDRIKELHERLGIRFPVYVVLSKCDLLAGFSEFFENLGHEERAQVWGLTFPLAKMGPGTSMKDSVFSSLASFPAEFQRLEQQLQCRLLDRLQQERDIQRRALIYSFPQQFSAIGDVLYDFLKRVFEPSRYEVAAMLRGVYFTSAVQQGQRIDQILGSTFSAGFSLEQKRISANGSRSYFISRLWREVIIREAGLAGVNLSFERHRRWLRWAALGVLGVILIVGGVSIIGSYLRNQHYVSDVSQHVVALEARAREISPQDDLALTLPLLSAVSTLPGGYSDRDNDIPLMMRLGLYQGERLGGSAQQLYRRLLKEILLPRVINRMEAVLRRGGAGNVDYVFETLRVYLMLGDRQHFDTQSVHAWIDYDWGSNPAGLDNAQRRELSNHATALLSMLGEIDPDVQLDTTLIDRTRLMLAGTPLEQRIYNRLMKELTRAKLPAFDIGMAGERDAYQVLMRNSGQPLSQGIEGTYTRAGYQKFLAQVDQSIADMVKDDWVMGRAQIDMVTAQEQQIKATLQQLYFDDYIKQWDAVLADVTVIPFASLDQAARMTTILSAADSPLRKFLQAVSKQTTLDDLKPVKIVPDSVSTVVQGQFNVAKQKFESLLGSKIGDVTQTNAKSINPVDAHFDALHKMVGIPGATTPSPLDQLLIKLRGVAVFFDAANGAKAAGLPVPAADALTELKREAIGKPAPLAVILQSIEGNGSGLALGSERERLNSLWTSSIAPFCRRAIANRYPLLRTATQEITPDDFGTFFGPGGMMDDFFKRNLRPYVDISGPQWRWRSINNMMLDVSERVLAEFQRAAIVRDKFFNTGEKQVSLRFDIKPLKVDPTFSKVLLDMDGQTLTYDQKTPATSASFQIPSAIGTNLTTLMTVPASGSGLKAEGPWAWFHMMDQGVLESSVQSERFKLSFDLSGKKLIFELTANSVNNPFKREALEQFHCMDHL